MITFWKRILLGEDVYVVLDMYLDFIFIFCGEYSQLPIKTEFDYLACLIYVYVLHSHFLVFSFHFFKNLQLERICGCIEKCQNNNMIQHFQKNKIPVHQSYHSFHQELNCLESLSCFQFRIYLIIR